MADKLTHVDESGGVHMVDVGGKEKTRRQAVVRGEIRMRAETVGLIREDGIEKGNVLETAALLLLCRREPRSFWSLAVFCAYRSSADVPRILKWENAGPRQWWARSIYENAGPW